MTRLVLIAAAACGAQSPPVPCDVDFSGNFTEHVHAAASCPTLASGELDASLDSHTLGEPITVVIDGVTLGTSTSDSTPSWSVLGAASIGDGACVYAAGAQAVPTGSFTLVLVSDAPPHGTLDVLQHIQATANTDCGESAEEMIHVEF